MAPHKARHGKKTDPTPVLKRALHLPCIGLFDKTLTDEAIFPSRRAADILGCSRLRIGVKKGIKTAQFHCLAN